VGGHDRDLIELAVESDDGGGEGDGDLVGGDYFCGDRAGSGAESVAYGRVDGGIHEALHGESYVFGGKGSAVGKVHAMAQLEGDLPAVGRDFPGLGEFGLEFLGVTVDAGENASGEVTDGESGVVID